MNQSLGSVGPEGYQGSENENFTPLMSQGNSDAHLESADEDPDAHLF